MRIFAHGTHEGFSTTEALLALLVLTLGWSSLTSFFGVLHQGLSQEQQSYFDLQKTIGSSWKNLLQTTVDGGAFLHGHPGGIEFVQHDSLEFNESSSGDVGEVSSAD